MDKVKELIHLLKAELNSVIVVIWKLNGKVEVYRNLVVFTDKYPEFNYESIDYDIGRNSRPHENDKITVVRCEVIRKAPDREPKRAKSSVRTAKK